MGPLECIHSLDAAADTKASRSSFIVPACLLLLRFPCRRSIPIHRFTEARSSIFLQQRIFPGEVFVKGGQISAIREVSQVDETDGFLMPGLSIPIHIESSLLTPPEFARLAVAHGNRRCGLRST